MMDNLQFQVQKALYGIWNLFLILEFLILDLT